MREMAHFFTSIPVKHLLAQMPAMRLPCGRKEVVVQDSFPLAFDQRSY